MTLADYLAQPGQSATALARDVGVAVSTITRASKGEIVPTGRLMQAIFEKTRGVVTPNDFLKVAA